MNKKAIGGLLVGGALVLGVGVGSLFLERVPNGYVAAIFSPNGGVKEQTLGQGWHLVGLFDKTTLYPIRLQTVVYNQPFSVATSDGKNISIDIAFSYNIEPDKVVSLFNKFGPVSVGSIEESYLRTRLWDAARKTISQYSVIDIYGEKSSEASNVIQERFSEDIGKLGFVVESVTLGVPEPDEATQSAINERVKAAQQLERTNLEREIAKAEAERLAIEAEAIANYNATIEASLSNEVLKQQWIEKWDGKMPLATGSNNLIEIPIGE